MEIYRTRVDAKLVNNDYLKSTSKPSFLRQKKFDNDLVAVHKIKTASTPNKQAYVGMCISELIKVPLYEFHYDYIKNKYSNKLRLLFTDSDSLV